MGRRTVPPQSSLVVEVISQDSLGVVEEIGGFFGTGAVGEHFVEEIGIVAARGFN